MLSLRQKELQGTLKLAPPASPTHSPPPSLSLSVCHSSVLHRPLWRCRYAASNVFAASKSSLISISIFSSSQPHFVFDWSDTPAVTLRLPFACKQRQNNSFIPLSPRLTSPCLRPSKSGSRLIIQWVWPALNNLLIPQRTCLRTWPWSEVTSNCQLEDALQRIFSLACHCEISCDGKRC